MQPNQDRENGGCFYRTPSGPTRSPPSSNTNHNSRHAPPPGHLNQYFPEYNTYHGPGYQQYAQHAHQWSHYPQQYRHCEPQYYQPAPWQYHAHHAPPVHPHERSYSSPRVFPLYMQHNQPLAQNAQYHQQQPPVTPPSDTTPPLGLPPRISVPRDPRLPITQSHGPMRPLFEEDGSIQLPPPVSMLARNSPHGGNVRGLSPTLSEGAFARAGNPMPLTPPSNASWFKEGQRMVTPLTSVSVLAMGMVSAPSPTGIIEEQRSQNNSRDSIPVPSSESATAAISPGNKNRSCPRRVYKHRDSRPSKRPSAPYPPSAKPETNAEDWDAHQVAQQPTGQVKTPPIINIIQATPRRRGPKPSPRRAINDSLLHPHTRISPSRSPSPDSALSSPSPRSLARQEPSAVNQEEPHSLTDVAEAPASPPLPDFRAHTPTSPLFSPPGLTKTPVWTFAKEWVVEFTMRGPLGLIAGVPLDQSPEEMLAWEKTMFRSKARSLLPYANGLSIDLRLCLSPYFSQLARGPARTQEVTIRLLYGGIHAHTLAREVAMACRSYLETLTDIPRLVPELETLRLEGLTFDRVRNTYQPIVYSYENCDKASKTEVMW